MSYHHLSKVTIAKMAKVKVGDIEKMVEGFADEVDTEAKYKITTTVMSLRFFLKECEPPIEEQSQSKKDRYAIMEYNLTFINEQRWCVGKGKMGVTLDLQKQDQD